jgi:thiol-disulfide isomerase/thioredoxin
MMMFKKCLNALPLVFAGIAMLSFSGEATGQSRFATARAELSAGKIERGGQGVMKVILQVPERAHVNSAMPSDPNLIPTSFTPDAVEGITWGVPEYPPVVEVVEWYSVDPLKVYGDGAVISVPFTVGQGAGALVRLSGVLNSQACDDEKCYPPKRFVVSIDLSIADAPTPSGAPSQPDGDKAGDAKVQPAAAAGDPLDFRFVDFDGKPRKLSDLRGKLVLLDFWATWCKPCLAEFPKLKSLYALYGPRGFEIVGLQAETLGDEEADADGLAEALVKGRATARRFEADWVMADPASSIEVANGVLKVEALPTKILIDKEGRILKIISGKDDLEAMLSEIFAEK